jgi:hypothetical protein
MTLKPIRWFEAPSEVPAAFHNPLLNDADPTQDSHVICLNYKDYDDFSAGVEPWSLTNRVASLSLITLLHLSNSFGAGGDWWGALKIGAQEMIGYAASDEEHGFKDGKFYGVFWLSREGQDPRPLVMVGFAYANSIKDLVPIRGLKELQQNDQCLTWVTPNFAIPWSIEVDLADRPIAPRVSRYKRSPVI